MELYKIIKLKFVKNHDEVLISFDNDTTLRIPTDLVYSLGLNSGNMISQVQFDEINKEIRLFNARKLAYIKATSSLKSRFQLKKILISKGFNEDEVEIAINHLEKLKIVDDEKFAKTAIEYLTNNKNYGLNKVKMFLFNKGIPKKIIEKVIAQEFDLIDQDKLILNYYKKNLPKIKRKSKQQRIPYCIRMFKTAGFSGEVIKNFLQTYKTEIVGL